MQGKNGLGQHLLPHGRFRVRVLLAMVRHHWFIRLRWIITLATLAILVLERLKTPELLRPHALMACIIVLGLVNLIWTILGRSLSKELHGEDAVAPLTIRC